MLFVFSFCFTVVFFPLFVCLFFNLFLFHFCFIIIIIFIFFGKVVLKQLDNKLQNWNIKIN